MSIKHGTLHMLFAPVDSNITMLLLFCAYDRFSMTDLMRGRINRKKTVFFFKVKTEDRDK